MEDREGIKQGYCLCKVSNLVILRAMHWKGLLGGKGRNNGKEKQLKGRRSAETSARVQDYGDCTIMMSSERRRPIEVTMDKLKLGYVSKGKSSGEGKRHLQRHIEQDWGSGERP